MVNQELIDYIKKQIEQGFNKEEIRNALIGVGWQETDINEAFSITGLSEPIIPQESISSKTEEPISSEPQESISKPKYIYSQPENIGNEISKKSPIGLIITIILALLIIGAGVFSYFYFFQKPKSEHVVKKMTEKMMKVKTFEYSGELITKEINKGYPPTEVLSSFNGLVDSEDKDNLRIESNQKIATDSFLGKKEDFDINIKFIKNVFYIKFSSTFFDQPEVPVFLKDIGWIKIDFKEIEEIIKQFIPTIDQQGIEDIQKKIDESLLLPFEKLEKIQEIVFQAEIFKIKEVLPDEKINRINVYHFKFLINKEELVKLFLELSKEMGQVAEEDWLMAEEQLKSQEFLDSLGEELEQEVEMWIGKKDFLLYRVYFNYDVKDETKRETSINCFIEFKNHNKPIQIEAPESFKNIKEVIFDIMTKLMVNFSNDPTMMTGFPFPGIE